MKNQLGPRIKKIRELRGYSQEFLAKKLGICQEQYSYIENKQKEIPEQTVQHIAEILDVSVEYLLHFDVDNILSTCPNTISPDIEGIKKLLIDGFTRDKAIYEEVITRLRNENAELKKELGKD